MSDDPSQDAPEDEIGVGGWQLSPAARLALRRASIDQALRTQDFDRASVELEELLEDQPDDRETLRLLAAVETERRDALTARAAWESVVELDPSDASAWLQLGFARFEVAALEEALHAARTASDLDPTLGEAWYLQALVGERSEAPDGVDGLYVRAFSLHPNACPLPLSLPDPRQMVRMALQDCEPAARTFWKEVPLRLRSYPDLARLTASVPPLSPRILAAYDGDPGQQAVPDALDVFVGNLRHHDTVEHAIQALSDAMEAEAWAWTGGDERT